MTTQLDFKMMTDEGLSEADLEAIRFTSLVNAYVIGGAKVYRDLVVFGLLRKARKVARSQFHEVVSDEKVEEAVHEAMLQTISQVEKRIERIDQLKKIKELPEEERIIKLLERVDFRHLKAVKELSANKHENWSKLSKDAKDAVHLSIKAKTHELAKLLEKNPTISEELKQLEPLDYERLVASERESLNVRKGLTKAAKLAKENKGDQVRELVIYQQLAELVGPTEFDQLIEMEKLHFRNRNAFFGFFEQIVRRVVIDRFREVDRRKTDPLIENDIADDQDALKDVVLGAIKRLAAVLEDVIAMIRKDRGEAQARQAETIFQLLIESFGNYRVIVGKYNAGRSNKITVPELEHVILPYYATCLEEVVRRLHDEK